MTVKAPCEAAQQSSDDQWDQERYDDAHQRTGAEGIHQGFLIAGAFNDRHADIHRGDAGNRCRLNITDLLRCQWNDDDAKCFADDIVHK